MRTLNTLGPHVVYATVSLLEIRPGLSQVNTLNINSTHGKRKTTWFLVTYTISRILYQLDPRHLSRKRYNCPGTRLSKNISFLKALKRISCLLSFQKIITSSLIAVIVRRDCYIFFGGRFDNADYSSEMSLKIQQNVELDIIKESWMSYKKHE